MSARQMYSTSIKSPFPPHPLPWLQSLPAFVVPPPPVQMPGWDGRQLTSRWPSPCAAFLLGVPRPPPPWDTSQCACALSPWQTDSSNPSDGLNRAISAFFFLSSQSKLGAGERQPARLKLSPSPHDRYGTKRRGRRAPRPGGRTMAAAEGCSGPGAPAAAQTHPVWGRGAVQMGDSEEDPCDCCSACPVLPVGKEM